MLFRPQVHHQFRHPHSRKRLKVVDPCVAATTERNEVVKVIIAAAVMNDVRVLSAHSAAIAVTFQRQNPIA
jgi:hypothetical protein